MPEFFSRLLQLLRVINYGPSLEDLLTSHLITHSAMTLDLSSFFSPFPPSSSSSSSVYSRQAKITDWNHFTSLEEMIRNEKEPSSISSNSEENTDEENAFLNQLLSAFSPSSSTGGGSLSRNNSASGGNTMAATPVELTNVINIIEVAQSIGIAHNLSPLGEALLLMQSLGNRAAGPLSNIAGNDNNTNRATTRGRTGAGATAGGGGGRRSMNTASTEAYLKAKKELVFHSMLLLSYQIELIFVLCTLLSGRRKIAVQKKLAKEGLGSVLTDMFRRMSFSLSTTPSSARGAAAASASGERTAVVLDETSHVTAIRIQYLRLIHCFYDRDFLGNENKLTILSSSERNFLLQSSIPQELEGKSNNNSSDTKAESEKQGLLMKIIDVLLDEKEKKLQEMRNNPSSSSSLMRPTVMMEAEEENEEKKESSDENSLGLSPESVSSSHHFWLFACLENFLRGSGNHGQFLFLRKKKEFLPFLISHILETVFPPSVASSTKGSAAFSSPPVSTTASSLSEAKKSILQSSFDLLNELIKGNPFITKELEEYLSSSPQLSQQFFFIIMNNLVESNVFIRSLFLNLKLFDKPTIKEGGAPPLVTIETGSGMVETSEEREALQGLEEKQQIMKRSSAVSSNSSLSSASSSILLEGYGFNINGLTNCENLYLLSIPFPSSSSASSTSSSSSLVATAVTEAEDKKEAKIFRFGYLMNSFVQFNNSFLNENAKMIFTENKEFYYNERRKRKTETSSSSSSSTSSSSANVTSPSRTSTLRNNIKEGIRKATTHLLRFGQSSSSTTLVAPASPPPAALAIAVAAAASSSSPSSSITNVTNNNHIILNEEQIIDKIISSAPPSVSSSFSIASSSQPVIQPHPLEHFANSLLIREESFLLFSTPPEEPRFSRFPRKNDDSSSSSSLQQKEGLRNLSSFPSFPSFGDSSCHSMNTALTSRLHAIHIDGEEESMMKENDNNDTEKTKDGMKEVRKVNEEMLQAGVNDLMDDSAASSSLFSSFMKHEKLNILFRLITSVSLKSINHENICCLNTALLLLLFDYHR
jgi:hypothetical protein